MCNKITSECGSAASCVGENRMFLVLNRGLHRENAGFSIYIKKVKSYLTNNIGKFVVNIN